MCVEYVCMYTYVVSECWRFNAMSATRAIFMAKCMYVCMCVCMDGWMDGWMDACMHACMCIHVCMI